MAAPWLRVVKDYPNKNGPTIPFILGALRRPVGRLASSDVSREELRALLVDMRDDASDSRNVVIEECMTIRQPIVKLSDNEQHGFIRFDSPSKAKRALYCQHIYDLPAFDFDSLVDCLWERYSQEITEGRFSFRNGTWCNFDETELAKLTAYCNIPERTDGNTTL